MRKYQVPFQNAVLTASILNSLHRIVSGSAYRINLWELFLGSRASADAAASFEMVRETAFTSGGVAITPAPIDQGDPASVATASTGATGTVFVGLTGTVIVLAFGMNQRGTYRFVCDPATPIKFAAAANAGAVLSCDSVSAAYNVDGGSVFSE